MKKHLLSFKSEMSDCSLTAASFSRVKVQVIKSQIIKPILLAALVTSLAACGGNKQQPVKSSSGEVTKDITLPPQTIVGREEVQQRNPDETISFDEWRKRRVEELKKNQKP